MTYSEKIEEMIRQVDKLYQDAEWLRDLATGEEKKYWNEHRRIFYSADSPLRELNNSLSTERANTTI
ncbi:MAG: hypothetical protein RIR12_1671 [Bacteroidota bacterium]|jgi:predicted DNA-binding protein